MNPADIVAMRRAALDRLASTKSQAQIKATELWKQRRGLQDQIKQSESIREIVSNHPFDLFPTPPKLAEKMVSLADIEPGMVVLEPSAGTGNIVKAIKNAGFECDCIELNLNAAEYLRSLSCPCVCTNFLEMIPRADKYDRIIMNPPFSKNQDIDHVLKAWEWLADGGKLVAIMSAGVLFRNDKKTAAFRQWLENQSADIEELPEGSFKQSGTNVNSVLVVLDK